MKQKSRRLWVTGKLNKAGQLSKPGRTRSEPPKDQRKTEEEMALGVGDMCEQPLGNQNFKFSTEDSVNWCIRGLISWIHHR